ncbi:hypothetical protein KQI84_06095 [bacterium]|nr:hypothetical protein [bacterium]
MFGRKKSDLEGEDLKLQPPPQHAPDGTSYPEGLRHNRFLVAPRREKGKWLCDVAEMDGSEVLEASQERPAKWRILPPVGTWVMGLLTVAVAGLGLYLLWTRNPWTALLVGILLLVCGAYVTAIVRRLLVVDLEVTVDSPESHQKLLKLIPEKRFSLRSQIFHVDWQRPPVKRIASIRREGLAGGMRSRWVVEGPPEQKHVAVLAAIEAPFWRAWLRRILLGRLKRRLVTNFKLSSPGGGIEWGKLHRRELVHDCHVLDVSRDWEGSLDRRAVLALAILMEIGASHPSEERKSKK